MQKNEKKKKQSIKRNQHGLDEVKVVYKSI